MNSSFTTWLTLKPRKVAPDEILNPGTKFYGLERYVEANVRNNDLITEPLLRCPTDNQIELVRLTVSDICRLPFNGNRTLSTSSVPALCETVTKFGLTKCPYWVGPLVFNDEGLPNDFHWLIITCNPFEIYGHDYVWRLQNESPRRLTLGIWGANVDDCVRDHWTLVFMKNPLPKTK